MQIADCVAGPRSGLWFRVPWEAFALSSRARSSGAGMEQGSRRSITVCHAMTELSVGSAAAATDIWRYSVGYGEKNNGAPDSTTLSLLGGGTALMRYGYDGLDRLTLAIENYGLSVLPGTCQANQGTRCQQFTYDALGNRAFGSQWNAALPGVAVTKFSSSNRIDQQDWIYDQRGNLSQVPKPAGLTDVFLFDVENRVERVCSGVLAGSACSATSQNVKYGYDADGRRVTKEAGGRLTVFVYDALGRLAVEDGAAPSSEAAPVILTADHLGSTRLVTKKTSLASGDPSYLSSVVVERRDYMPFGDEISFSSGDPRSGVSGYGVDVTTSRKFTGKERDPETGLDYFGARYFSGAQGRFTSPDPVIVTPARMVDPQRFNLYAYARNNPFKFIDPNGEDIEFVNDTEEGRKKALALVTKNMRANEAANIGMRQRKDGSYEAYVIDQKAIGKDASAGYKSVAGLIGDHRIVADVGVVVGGLTATFKDLGQVSSYSQQSSVVEPAPGSRHVSVLVTQGDFPGGTQVWCCGGKAVYQGWQPDFVTMYHELVGETLKYQEGHGNLRQDGTLDNRTVIKIENEIRQFHGMNPRTGADHGMPVITVQGKVQ